MCEGGPHLVVIVGGTPIRAVDGLADQPDSSLPEYTSAPGVRQVASLPGSGRGDLESLLLRKLRLATKLSVSRLA